MRPLDQIRSFLWASLVFVALASVARPAWAGTLHVRDEAHILSASDQGRIRAAVSAAPYDARLVVTSEYPDAAELSRYVGSLVSEANMVVVGLDSEHRHVQVHFGTATRIAHSSWTPIERAGNDAFRRGAWADGVVAIYDEAARAYERGPGTGAQAAPAVQARPSLLGPFLFLLVIAGVVAIAVQIARRRQQPFGGPMGPGYGPGAYSGPNYPPGYPMGPPQGGGMGPVGGGLIGAGLGGLAGYELGKMAGERDERERGPVREDRGVPPAGSDDNFDAGGGGSSWDDQGGGGGDGGGGFDGGGGDSGGGSDF
jgi:Domain of unknown function (DUF5129)